MRSSLFLLVAVGTATLPFAAAGCGSGSGSGQTITVIEHATTDAITDTGTKGDSAGDVLTFANEVFDAGNTKKVGTSQGYCIRTEPGVAYECTWTTSLTDGQITVEGPFLDKEPSMLAITGGTGSYDDAQGTMDLSPNNDAATEFKFVFKLN